MSVVFSQCEILDYRNNQILDWLPPYPSHYQHIPALFYISKHLCSCVTLDGNGSVISVSSSNAIYGC